MRERLVFGHGRPHVFLHAGLSDGSEWLPLFEHRPEGAKVVALDLPELGYDAPGTRLGDLDAQLDAYLEARFPEGGLTLVGHSLGAWLGARALSRQSRRIERAVLVAGVVTLPVEAQRAYEQLAHAIETGEAGFEQTIDGIVRQSFGGALTPELLRAGVEMLQHYSPARFARALRLLSSLPGHGVKPYTVPSVIVQAVMDPIVPAGSAQQLCALGAEATLELWEGDCHMLPLSEPARLAQRVFG